MTEENARFRASFGPIGERLGFPLRQADIRWLTSIGERLKPLGITPARAAALFFIEHNPGCSQAKLGRALRINRPSTVRVVDELEAIGAVERRKQSPNARDNALHLTAQGIRLHREIDRITIAHEDEFFAVLSDTERERLRRILLKLLAGNATTD